MAQCGCCPRQHRLERQCRLPHLTRPPHFRLPHTTSLRSQTSSLPPLHPPPLRVSSWKQRSRLDCRRIRAPLPPLLVPPVPAHDPTPTPPNPTPEYHHPESLLPVHLSDAYRPLHPSQPFRTKSRRVTGIEKRVQQCPSPLPPLPIPPTHLSRLFHPRP